MMRWFDKKQPVNFGNSRSSNPLDAIPVIAHGVETRTDSNGCLQLRKPAPEGSGLVSRLAVRMGFRRALRANLDTQGTLYWTLVDGTRTLAEIEQAIRSQTGQDEKETRRAVVMFTKTLMMRHLICLKLPDGPGAPPRM